LTAQIARPSPAKFEIGRSPLGVAYSALEIEAEKVDGYSEQTATAQES
jgi:hypothetical protein